MGNNMAAGPEICIEGEFRIDASGIWFHEGAPIGRKEMVNLFARALVRDARGGYWLETPVEKVPVIVEDAPFLAVELQVQGRAAAQLLRLRTNIDSWVELGADHPLIATRATQGKGNRRHSRPQNRPTARDGLLKSQKERMSPAEVTGVTALSTRPQ